MKNSDKQSESSAADEIFEALKAGAIQEEKRVAERNRERAEHAKRAIAKQIAKGKPRQLGDLGQTDKYHQDIYYYLERIFKKECPMPSLAAALESKDSDEAIVAFRYLDAVVKNQPLVIRRLADAVERVHKRIRVEGDKVELIPAKPGLKKLVEECMELSHKTPSEDQPLPSTRDQTLSSGLSDTVVKEVRAAYDVQRGKRGPKPRAPKPVAKKVTQKGLSADVSEGFKHFQDKRKKKKTND